MNESDKLDAKSLLKLSTESFSKGYFDKAELIARKALVAAEKEDSLIDIASSYHIIGTALSKRARYAEALKAHSQALTIKNEIGEKDSSIAASLNQLAQVYSAIGQFQKAEHLYRRSLSLIEKTGDKNSEAIALSNIASVQVNMDRLSEAEALYKKALDIQVTIGSEQTATTYNNLGNLYFSLNDLEKAYLSYQKSVSLMKEHLGETHPDTAIAINNLAYVLAEKGHYEEASKLFKESLENLRRTYGSNHPYIKKLKEREASLRSFSSGSEHDPGP